MDAAFVLRPVSWRSWLAAGLILLVVGVSIQYTLKAAEDRSAFVRWRKQLHALVEGKDVYQLYLYPNAPIMGLILYPLSLLPRVSLFGWAIDLGALAWFYAKLAMTLLSFIWVFRLVQQEDRPFPPVAQAVVVLLSLRPIVGDLTHGNVNLLILFLVVAALYAFKRERDRLAGLLLALGIACKVTPALFLPYFLWKRAWRVVAGCLTGLLLFFLLIPGALLGPVHNLRLLASWTEKMILPYVMAGEVIAHHNNQSLPGLIYRLGTASPAFRSEDGQPAEFYNFLCLEPAIARRIVQGCGLAFMVLLCWSCRTPTQLRDNWRLATEYSLVVLGMLLFSERTWKHHCVTLLLPLAGLCYYLAVMQPRIGRCCYLIASLAAAMLLIAATSTSLWELFGYRLGAKLAQVYGAYVGAELILLAALVAVLRPWLRISGQKSEDSDQLPKLTSDL